MRERNVGRFLGCMYCLLLYDNIQKCDKHAMAACVTFFLVVKERHRCEKKGRTVMREEVTVLFSYSFMFCGGLGLL